MSRDARSRPATCMPRQRDDARRAADAIEHAHTAVRSVDVLPPTEGPVSAWTVEATLFDVQTVPPAVLDALAEHDCELRPTAPPAPDVVRVVAVI